MVKIVWTQNSVYDLKGIFHYISKDSKRYAEIQIRRLKDRAQILKTKPELGRIVPELELENIRELIEGNYRIIYRKSEKQIIEILTIHHSARDFNVRDILPE